MVIINCVCLALVIILEAAMAAYGASWGFHLLNGISIGLVSASLAEDVGSYMGRARALKEAESNNGK